MQQVLQVLAYLACPLMMIFCMKGMFSGGKDSKTNNAQFNITQQELQNLQLKMADLIEENQKLAREVQAMKGSSSNMVELNEEKSKRVVF